MLTATPEIETANASAPTVSMEVEEFRPRYGRGLATAVLVVAALAFLISMIMAPGSSWRYLPILALVVTVTWAFFWFPAVVVSPAGVELRNVTRTIVIPWPALQSIDTRWALTLHSAVGSHSSWAATSSHGHASFADAANARYRADTPGGMQRLGSVGRNSSAGGAAAIVQRRWDELKRAGLLNNSQLERTRPEIRWHWRIFALIAALAVATALTFTLI